MKRSFSLFLLLSFLSSTTPAHAGNFGCESVGGSVIFKDTFYGVLTGALLSGLYLATQKGHSDSGSIVAAGAAGGGVFGLGLGLAEVTFRDCPDNYGQTKGFHSRIAALTDGQGDLAPGLKMSWNF